MSSAVNGEWFVAPPLHWSVKALRFVAQITNGATPKSGDERNWDGDITWVTPEDLGSLTSRDLFDSARKITQIGYESCGTTLVPPNSLVVSTRAPIGHIAIGRVPFCVNQGCRALTLKPGHSPEFFCYQLLAVKEVLASFGQGSTFRELSRDRLASFRVLVPPASEQRAIAAFLDCETAKIDRVHTRLGTTIPLLLERRIALISAAVTGKIDVRGYAVEQAAE